MRLGVLECRRWRSPAARPAIMILAAVTASCAAGCSSDGLVATQGVVRLDGKPLAGVTVQFRPLDQAKGRYAYGGTDESGNFRLVSEGVGERLDGVMPGEYKVTILRKSKRAIKGKKDKSAEAPIPPEYGSLENTPFKVSIPHDGDVVLELKSRGG